MGHHDRPYYASKETLWKTIWSWLYTVDHKKIGVMYLCAVLLMFFLGGVFPMICVGSVAFFLLCLC